MQVKEDYHKASLQQVWLFGIQKDKGVQEVLLIEEGNLCLLHSKKMELGAVVGT